MKVYVLETTCWLQQSLANEGTKAFSNKRDARIAMREFISITEGSGVPEHKNYEEAFGEWGSASALLYLVHLADVPKKELVLRMLSDHTRLTGTWEASRVVLEEWKYGEGMLVTESQISKLTQEVKQLLADYHQQQGKEIIVLD